MPSIIIIAGPNGAGKSTFIQGLRKDETWQEPTVLNADQIEVSSGQHINIARARVAVARLDGLILEGADIILETTLATRRLAQKIPVWRDLGYQVELIYLGLPSVDASIRRVAERVSRGGHDIPEVDLLRRFPLSRQYFDHLYKPCVHNWTELELLEDGTTGLVDFGENEFA